MTAENTRRETEIAAVERILADALGFGTDRYYRHLAEDCVDAAIEASEPFESVGEAMGVTSSPLNPARRFDRALGEGRR